MIIYYSFLLFTLIQPYNDHKQTVLFFVNEIFNILKEIKRDSRNIIKVPYLITSIQFCLFNVYKSWMLKTSSLFLKPNLKFNQC